MDLLVAEPVGVFGTSAWKPARNESIAGPRDKITKKGKLLKCKGKLKKKKKKGKPLARR